MTFDIITLGCKVNQYESQAVREQFISAGYEQFSESPDVFLINSCTVTAESDRKTRQYVRRYRAKYPAAVLVLFGCMPQAFPEAAKELDCADIVLGHIGSVCLPNMVEEFIKSKRRVISVTPHESGERFCGSGITSFAERHRAYLKIEDGCNRFCSYCVIPFARGRVRSKPLEDITAEAEKIAANGYKEIVLVGINLSAYGSDFGSGTDLSDAVLAVDKALGIGGRIRLGSMEPDQLSDKLLDTLAKTKNFCPGFHLSLQSGCDKTLTSMNRRYDTAFYFDLVSRIQSRFENPAITTDIMVGFAGETEEDFQESVCFLKRIGFANTHVFSYSRRAGTVAYLLKDQVTATEKHRRSTVMQAAAAECEAAFCRSQIGTMAEVLLETVSPCGDSYVYRGYTRNYTPVHIISKEPSLCGDIITFKLTENNIKD